MVAIRCGSSESLGSGRRYCIGLCRCMRSAGCGRCFVRQRGARFSINMVIGILVICQSNKSNGPIDNQNKDATWRPSLDYPYIYPKSKLTLRIKNILIGVAGLYMYHYLCHSHRSAASRRSTEVDCHRLGHEPSTHCC